MGYDSNDGAPSGSVTNVWANFSSRFMRLAVCPTKHALKRKLVDGSIEVLLSKRSRDRIGERVRELIPRNWGSSLEVCILRLNAYLVGWLGFFGICTLEVEMTLRAVDAHIRRRLRALTLKDWKRKRTIARKLIEQGVKPKTAWRCVYEGRKSPWALSHAPAVERGLRNAYFAERGLVSLLEKWKADARYIAAPVQLTLPLG